MILRNTTVVFVLDVSPLPIDAGIAGNGTQRLQSIVECHFR